MKTVPDMDKVPDADWASGAASCRCDFSYVPKIPDPYCESGAELVLRMMDEASAKAGDAQVITADAITIGDRLAEKPLRTLAALGYRSVYRIVLISSSFTCSIASVFKKSSSLRLSF